LAWERSFTGFGIALILLGIALIIIPIIAKLMPDITLEKIPWFLLYIYHRDGFFFATSPLLIIIGMIYFLWTILHR